jgi:stage II sporulation protein AA (anti-sigma F factor antagonist)
MRTAAMELILDFSGVTFMDSSGIGLILGRYRWMQSTGGSVRITHIAPYLEQLLLLSNIHRLVSVEVEKPEEHIVEETGRDIYSDSSKEVRYDAK